MCDKIQGTPAGHSGRAGGRHRLGGAGCPGQPGKHGLLHRLLPAGHRRRRGDAPGRHRAVHPARDHRSGAGRHDHGPGGQRVQGAGRLLPHDPVRAGLLRHGGCPHVPGLPPADGHPPGRRRRKCHSGPGGLHHRHLRGHSVPEGRLLPQEVPASAQDRGPAHARRQRGPAHSGDCRPRLYLLLRGGPRLHAGSHRRRPHRRSGGGRHCPAQPPVHGRRYP